MPPELVGNSKAVLKGKLIGLQEFIREEERPHINNWSAQLKKLENDEKWSTNQARARK